MSDDLVLHTNPNSRGRIARWMLEETGAAYRVVIEQMGEALSAPDYLALNPLGKVPVLEHRGVVITETAAICAYLADAFPEAGLAPPPAERGLYYRWFFFGSGVLEPAAIDRAFGRDIPPERRGMSGYGAYARVMEALDGALSARDYIAGDAFTAADVFVGAHIAWGMQFDTVEKRPSFEAYTGRLAARAAYQKSMALDNADGEALKNA